MSSSTGAFNVAIGAAINRRRPFIAYQWVCNNYVDGQKDSGFLVVSLGEAEVKRVLTAAQAKQEEQGKVFPPTMMITVKPDKYLKDIEKLRKQGRLRRLIIGDKNGEIEKDESYDW